MVTKKKEESEDWRDVALHFAVGTMRELGNTVLRSFHEKVDQVVSSVVRRIFSVLLLCTGLIFVLVGLAKLLGELLGGSPSIGYVLVGALAILMAMVINVARGEKM